MKIQEQCKEIQSQLLTSIRILRSSNSSSTTVIQGFANSVNLVKEFSGGETNSLRPSKKGTKVLDSKIKSIQGRSLITPRFQIVISSYSSSKWWRLSHKGKRTLVLWEKWIPHKLVRTEGRQTSNGDIHSVTKVGISIHVRIDNMASISYLMGGTKSQELVSVSIENLFIWIHEKSRGTE